MTNTSITDMINTIKEYIEYNRPEAAVYKTVMPEYEDNSEDIAYCVRLNGFSGDAKRHAHNMNVTCRYRINIEKGYYEENAYEDAFELWYILASQQSLKQYGIATEGASVTSTKHDKQHLYYVIFNIRIIC
jgi:hypothetical protein